MPKKPTDDQLFSLYEREICPFDVKPNRVSYAQEKAHLVHTIRKVLAAKTERGAERVLNCDDWGHPAVCTAIIRCWAGYKPSPKTMLRGIAEIEKCVQSVQRNMAHAAKEFHTFITSTLLGKVDKCF